jgi:hypothetical protein
MKYNPVSRRLFLQGACGATLALPFLESLAPKQAHAAGPAKRFIALKTYNPPIMWDWYSGRNSGARTAKFGPGSKADGTFLATTPLVEGTGYTQAPLADWKEAGFSRIISKALAPFYEKMLVIRGLDFIPLVNHNDSGFLGHYDSEDAATPSLKEYLKKNMLTRTFEQWPTIDQTLAASKKFYATAPAQRTVQVAQGTGLGISFGGTYGNISRQPQRKNPKDLYNDLFGRFMPMGGKPMADGAKAREVALVDRVLNDYKAALKNPRLSKADRQHLEFFVNHIAELGEKVKVVRDPVSCTKPGEPTAGDAEDSASDVVAKWDAFVDIIVAAIICDQTRIASFDIRKALKADGSVLFHNQDGFSGWHGDAHNWGSVQARDRMSQANKWVAENIFLKIIQKLDVPESGGKTYLDNSIVYWGNELGFNHIPYGVPCLMAGSAGGYLKTGRYIDYIDWNGKSYFSQEGGNVITGIPHNQLLNTILQAMGLEPADYEQPDHKGYGIIEPIQKTKDWATEWKMANIGQILPGIRA